MQTKKIDPFPVFSGLKQSEEEKRRQEEAERQETLWEELIQREIYANDPD